MKGVEHIGDIIDKMMEKDPGNRFQTAADIATTLGAWLIEHGGEWEHIG